MREKATGDVHWFIPVCIAALGGYLAREEKDGAVHGKREKKTQ